MKVLSVVGARPQFVKVAPIASAADNFGVHHVVVHTGQHYDRDMSDSFFAALAIPEPDINLHIGSAPHAAQTGAMLTALEPVMADHVPDWVLVYGDTNSTLAAAICATKLHLPLAHLEAGLRSFNRRMPEEHNRVLADHSADLCLAPTQVAMAHLRNEGLSERSVLVGDVMTDVFERTRMHLLRQPVGTPIDSDGLYALATIHRPENTDDPKRLNAILKAISATNFPVYLAAHPRLVARAREFGVVLEQGAIRLVRPLLYPQLVQGLLSASTVITDSGGLQKEAYLAGVPTITVRCETEWVETLHDGWNVLASEPTDILEAMSRRRPSASRGNPYGDGRASEQVLKELSRRSS